MANCSFFTIKDTIGHREAQSNDRDKPSIMTGTNEFINVNMNNAWDNIDIRSDKITQKILYPVESTNVPKIGDVITVARKNILKFQNRYLYSILSWIKFKK